MDASSRKVSTAETIIRTVSQERDSAVSQLSIAYVTIEQLKIEMEGLMNENQSLKSRLGQMSGGHARKTSNEMAKDHGFQCGFGYDTGAINSKPDVADESTRNNGKGMATTDLQENIGSNGPTVRQIPQIHPENPFDLRSRRKLTKEAIQDKFAGAFIEDSQASDDSMHETTMKQGKTLPSSKLASSRRLAKAEKTNPTQDLTYLSFLDVSILPIFGSITPNIFD